MNKKKNINDPLYGFLTLPFDLLFDLIEHPWFQRLRRIRQLGMSHLVFPGAHHTRFHHALGALYLMNEAIKNLRVKGTEVSDEEHEAACIAILLHDIGHGPFSHTLEHSLVMGVHHEEISLAMMEQLNHQMNGRLEMALQIFKNLYPKYFLHQLVSGQLDMDRLDYLRRDSFYTGVSEGVVSSDRIIKMLAVHQNELVVEEKGIYSVEKFIVARRLMYWQVYLHKTVVAAEELLLKILQRARELAEMDISLFATPSLHLFLHQRTKPEDFLHSPALLNQFAQLDDNDIMASIKVWQHHDDFILSLLCKNLISRKLPKIYIRKEPFTENEMSPYKQEIQLKLGLSDEECSYMVYSGDLENHAYSSEKSGIKILMKNGNITDIADASDNYNISALRNSVKKHFLCYYKL